ncbi:PorP/SprF family type IX secretion system membrane protein [Pontibacter harenae]|uniref:PorP/SprF family type IX secretion system membrane protein n=1 Tax=Pontibacter harenae TaxID=2894083 RepID=UPI001E51F9D0|nr:PorP/SprF family type IX secretion system membrane protein [Pontibacter harenae]MCC9166337.1 PorP/SprF family type IX secretion system membrane protein [Pontibacter harenae]
MKKLIILAVLAVSVLGVKAQSRKHVANFSLFQQYFNPALTGYEGSMAKSFYRNQWTGFEGAPNTIFASAELDLADMADWRSSDVLRTERQDRYDRHAGAKHAFGIAVLHDVFGPFNESQVQLSYGSRIRLSKSLSLRWGGALAYTAMRLDGNKLTVDQENDAEYQDFLGRSNRMGKLDVNLGLMLTSENYYLGYAIQDITQDGIVASGDDFVEGMFQRQHVVQAGYRTALSDQFGLVANAMYRSDAAVKESMEGQVKAVYQNNFWAGGGYRKDLAYSVTAGVRLDQLKIGYVYEVPSGDATYISRGTNEISITYNLIPAKHPKYSRQVTMW